MLPAPGRIGDLNHCLRRSSRTRAPPTLSAKHEAIPTFNSDCQVDLEGQTGDVSPEGSSLPLSRLRSGTVKAAGSERSYCIFGDDQKNVVGQPRTCRAWDSEKVEDLLNGVTCDRRQASERRGAQHHRHHGIECGRIPRSEPAYGKHRCINEALKEPVGPPN